MAAGVEKPSSVWRRLSVPLRVIVSGALLAVLVLQSDPARIWALLRAIDLRLFGMALLLQLAGVVLSAAKWGVLLRYQGQRVPLRWLVGCYLVGQFVGTFLPTVVGGDALRVAQLGRRIESYAQASASIFVERVTGFLALCCIAGAAIVFGAAHAGAPSAPVAGLPLIIGGFALAVLAVLIGLRWAPAIYGAVERWVPRGARSPISRVIAALAAYVPRGLRLVAVLAISFLFQLIWIALHVACGLALGINAPVWVYATMVPITDIVGLAPIFLNNIGARDLIFTFYLGQVGVPASLAIALAFAIFAVRLIVSAFGGLVMLTQSFGRHAGAAASSEL